MRVRVGMSELELSKFEVCIFDGFRADLGELFEVKGRRSVVRNGSEGDSSCM